MGEWWTYTLSDFLMFSPQAYARLVERYNLALWPLHVLAPGAGVLLLALVRLRTPGATRAALVLLALAWLWTGWAFHWQRYAEIFLAAPYLAVASWAQAVLLLACCFARNQDASRPWQAWFGWPLLAVGTVLYPLIAPLAGSPWPQAEIFGVMPDPTSAATLGYVLLAPLAGRQRILLAGIPAASLAMGLLTRWTLAQ